MCRCRRAECLKRITHESSGISAHNAHHGAFGPHHSGFRSAMSGCRKTGMHRQHHIGEASFHAGPQHMVHKQFFLAGSEKRSADAGQGRETYAMRLKRRAPHRNFERYRMIIAVNHRQIVAVWRENPCFRHRRARCDNVERGVGIEISHHTQQSFATETYVIVGDMHVGGRCDIESMIAVYTQPLVCKNSHFYVGALF